MERLKGGKDMGFTEILLIMAIALILFGPEDLPDIARTIGKIIFEVRKATQDLTREFQNSMDIPSSSHKNEQETHAPQSGAEVSVTDEVLLKYEDESPDDPLAELPLDMVSYEEKGASR
jgi:Tat protein translocase TatB subunit